MLENNHNPSGPGGPGVTAGTDVPDYRTTALRRPWTELPAALQARLSGHLGAAVASVQPAGGGFTQGFAAVLQSSSGRRIFTKAARASDTFIYPSYLREAEVMPLMPAGMPIPRLRAAEQLVVDGVSWQLLVYDAVDGVMPGYPWTDADLQSVEEACVTAARLLRDFPRGLAGDPLAADLAGVPSQFLPLAAGRPAPWFLPGLTTDQAADFQDLLEFCPQALAGNDVLHGDLRPDNVLAGPGRAVICDWNFLGTGPAWTDWTGVLPYARAGGLDVDAWLLRSTLTRDVPPRYIDAFLVALLNYMLHSGGQPEVPSSPSLRSHGRHTARLVYDWLVQRRSLTTA